MEGYQAFQKLSAANAERVTTIDRDREFDQTARSETPGPRSVSPSILEHRIQMQDREIQDLTERLRVATEWIAGFEKFYASFAAQIDLFETAFKVMTGESVAVFIGNRDLAAEDTAPAPMVDRTLVDCGLPAPTPNEYEIGKCIFPRGHSGTCSIGV